MAADPLVRIHGRDGLDTPEAQADREALLQSHARVLVDAGLAETERVVEYTNVLNGFSALISHDEAVALAARPEVALVMPDVMRQPTTDASPEFLGLTVPGGAYDSGVEGDGVVVGVIDTGIWPEHPSFADDGSYPPPPQGVNRRVPCEFGNTAHNPLDLPFECQNKLLGARQVLPTYRALIGATPEEFDSARDDNGHGSHTAGTSAGNEDVQAILFGRDLGLINGIAHRAHIIAYKGLGHLGGFSSDLALAIDFAVADGVDVINYSIGGGAGLTGVDDIAFLFAADAGVYVAASAGNSGPGDATIGGPANLPWVTTVGANTQARFFPGRATLGDGSSYTGASLTKSVGFSPLVDAEDAGDELCLLGSLDPAVVTGAIVLCKRGVNARVEKSQAVLEAGGVGMILYNASDVDNLYTDTHFVPTTHIDLTPGLEIKEYIDTAANPTARIRVPNTTTIWESAPSMTIFSSRGPNSVGPDIIKPDITAPGLQILAASAPPFNLDQSFMSIAGTSMSSPHIAGVFALIKQVHPDWTPAMARSAMMTTAHQDVVDNDRVTPAGPFDMGAGHVDPGLPSQAGSMFQPGLVYNAGFNDYLGFLCSEAPEIFLDPVATCALLESLGIPTDPSDLNYPSIGVAELAGSQTVTRTVGNVGSRATYTVSVDEPAGIDVTVEPSSFTLARGERQTYEVTLTNDGTAVIGEWTFGSLTWTSGDTEVRSPIAVNPSLFDAPVEIFAEGTDGSVEFEISFGYTGEYTAAAHGLEPATITSDTVVQDPDQVFDPADGFSNAHQFELSGDTFFRVAIPPEATEEGADLDVFVYDPNGDLVASSTLGGTDEEVSIYDPIDGTWTVWVHGWLTIGPDSDYDMYSWILSETPGGNLVIDSAPTEAVLGETGTVVASWTDAPDEWNLGAVSHSDADGIFGLTLINVDNRP